MPTATAVGFFLGVTGSRDSGSLLFSLVLERLRWLLDPPKGRWPNWSGGRHHGETVGSPVHDPGGAVVHPRPAGRPVERRLEHRKFGIPTEEDPKQGPQQHQRLAGSSLPRDLVAAEPS